jgi:hypothetical protein
VIPKYARKVCGKPQNFHLTVNVWLTFEQNTLPDKAIVLVTMQYEFDGYTKASTLTTTKN